MLRGLKTVKRSRRADFCEKGVFFFSRSNYCFARSMEDVFLSGKKYRSSQPG